MPQKPLDLVGIRKAEERLERLLRANPQENTRLERLQAFDEWIDGENTLESTPMARKPTGRPKGRPKGTTKLGAQATKFSLWMPEELFNNLELFAERQHYTSSQPKLAQVVRQALEHFLACPNKLQTIYTLERSSLTNSPPITRTMVGSQTDTSENISRMPENGTVGEAMLNQTGIEPAERATVPLADALLPDMLNDSELEPHEYDQTRYYLGALCKHRHEWRSSGQSLRGVSNRTCTQCRDQASSAAKGKKRSARKAQAALGPLAR
jgi:hypothetical protein